ncbi:MAG: PAS domain S-box protein [Terriglobales bacterium]
MSDATQSAGRVAVAGPKVAAPAEHATYEEQRRADVLTQCVRVLPSRPDLEAAIHTLAENVRALLNATLVVVTLKDGDQFRLRALSAANPDVAAQWRSRCPHGECLVTDPDVQRAIVNGKPDVVHVQLDDAVPADVLVAPFETARTVGALMVCGQSQAGFCPEDLGLVEAVARFGALAIANAELSGTANARARELQQLVEISSELGSIGELDEFLQKFVVRAAEFLGFGRAFLALVEGNACHVRWACENGVARPLNFPVPEPSAARLLASRDVAWSDDVAADPNADQELAAMFSIKQYLALPLIGSEGRPLGILGVLDQHDGIAIGPEDIRRGKALAAQVALVLEAKQNIHLAQMHRQRAEALTSVALELNSSLRLPSFVQNFTERAAAMLGASSAALALARGPLLDTVVFIHNGETKQDKALLRRFNMALTGVSSEQQEPMCCMEAGRAFGMDLAASLGWRSVTLARLTGSDRELLGILVLGDCQELNTDDRNLLQALTSHAAVALENARLFTRMDQANRHWMEIFDSISDLIVVHDQANNVLRVNHSLADFIGVRPQQLIGVAMRALVSMAADSNGLQPCPFCRPDGEGTDEYIHPVLERTYLVSTSRIHGALNEGMQTIHVLKDITDRREAERRYRELFDNIQEGLFFSSPDGRFVEVNDALVRMLGYESREELLQVDIGSQLYLSPAHRHRFEMALEKSGGVLRNFEEALRRKDGSIVHTLQNAFAVRDAHGRITQYRGLMLDITELKNFQAELQRERDFSSKILNNTQSLILVVDTAGLISYANRRCYQAGNYSETQLLGRRLIELVLPTRADSMTLALDACLEGKHVDNLELPIVLGSGHTGQFSINLSPMRDEQGNVNSIVVVMTDITDAAMLQAKLMHTEKMAAVGQLVSGVAHEVNNPLTAVLGFTDLLLQNPDIPDVAKKDLAIILQESQRTKQIVQNLLSFARQTPPKKQPVQVNYILRRTLALRSYDFANHDVTVVEHFDPKLPEVVGDAHQLQQVFLNILNNAYDAVCETGRPGHIEVQTGVEEGCAEVRFRDNGPGISNPDRIFDPFFTTKEVGKGTGLGLSICYGIVHEHGGEITCHNNVGQSGATFIVRLPLAAPAAAAAGGQA